MVDIKKTSYIDIKMFFIIYFIPIKINRTRIL